MIYLITYELSEENVNLQSLSNEIRTWKWWQYLKTVWIISTDDNINAIIQRLQQHLNENDLLFVVDITNKPRNGWMPRKAWFWLNNQEDRKLEENTHNNND